MKRFCIDLSVRHVMFEGATQQEAQAEFRRRVALLEEAGYTVWSQLLRKEHVEDDEL